MRAFKKCEDLSYPLPAGITNYGIALKVYGSVPGSGGRNENIELPDYEDAAKLMATRKNITLMFLWNRYKKKCEEGARFYQYSQYCELYNKWCEENYETAHFDVVIAQKMEVDFTGQTFSMTDPLTGEIMTNVVFAAILPYSGARIFTVLSLRISRYLVIVMTSFECIYTSVHNYILKDL